jgi:putative hydrolase of the HAD superfamily
VVTPESFQHVLRDLGTPPGSVLFLDDNPECVEAAQRLDIVARRARGVAEVRAAMAELGLLQESAG